ncbi:Uncharacterised protein [uncultured archaeon]|nr:Uncharacterised protein [uncultured archaeon]
MKKFRVTRIIPRLEKFVIEAESKVAAMKKILEDYPEWNEIHIHEIHEE